MSEQEPAAQPGVLLRADELAEVERVASISDLAFACVARQLAAAIRDGTELWLGGVPLTVGHLRQTVATGFAAEGLREPDGNLIAVGAEAAEPHHDSDDQRRILAGEGVLVDLFPRSGKAAVPVFSDCSRTFCRGSELPQAVALQRAARHVARVKQSVEADLETRVAKGGDVRGFDLHRFAQRVADVVPGALQLGGQAAVEHNRCSIEQSLAKFVHTSLPLPYWPLRE